VAPAVIENGFRGIIWNRRLVQHAECALCTNVHRRSTVSDSFPAFSPSPPAASKLKISSRATALHASSARRSGERRIQASLKIRRGIRIPRPCHVGYPREVIFLLILVKIQHANRRPPRIPHHLEATLCGVNGWSDDPSRSAWCFSQGILVIDV